MVHLVSYSPLCSSAILIAGPGSRARDYIHAVERPAAFGALAHEITVRGAVENLKAAGDCLGESIKNEYSLHGSVLQV
jgi:hypothetical protein